MRQMKRKAMSMTTSPEKPVTRRNLENSFVRNDTVDPIKSVFPEKISNLAAEISRLMRDGGPEGRKKAQELMREALNNRTPANGHAGEK